MRSTLLAFASLLAIAPAADAKCEYYGLTAGPIGGTDVAIAGDGGVVIGAIAQRGHGNLDRGDVAVQPKWRVRGKGAALTPAVEALAPGLAVYRAPAGTTAFALLDDAGATIGKAHVDAKAAPRLAAPKVKAATYTGMRHGRKPWGRLTIDLDGAVPAGAIAIIAADVKGVARSWGTLAAGQPVLAFETRRCQALPNGTAESPPGDKIVLMWVDASGRKSPASAPVVVGGTIDPDEDP